MRAIKYGLVFLSSLVLASCTPWRAEFLEDVKGKANQDAVVMRLGPPTSEKVLSTGDAVWIYRYTGAAVGQSGGGTWCKEYLLKFDSQKVLRDWNRQNC
mgnify:CR=1 FL=1